MPHTPSKVHQNIQREIDRLLVPTSILNKVHSKEQNIVFLKGELYSIPYTSLSYLYIYHQVSATMYCHRQLLLMTTLPKRQDSELCW